jgi:membrane protein YdbS with pleckstrin-like domain
MIYNADELSSRVKKRKKEFGTKASILLLLAIAFTATALIFSEPSVIFISVCLIILSAVLLIRVMRKYEPFVLFSREVRGINIKEHEFVVTDRRVFRFGSSYLITKRRLKTSEFISTKARTKPPTSAIVYLRLPD